MALFRWHRAGRHAGRPVAPATPSRAVPPMPAAPPVPVPVAHVPDEPRTQTTSSGGDPHPSAAADVPVPVAPDPDQRQADPGQVSGTGPCGPSASVGVVLRDGRHFALAPGDPGAEAFRTLVGELLGDGDVTRPA